MKRVFLGGTTVEGTNWRSKIIPLLKEAGFDYFDPFIKKGEWDEKAKQNEKNERALCDFCVYCITPKMTGVYAIAEVVDDSNKRPQKVIFIVLSKDGTDTFDDAQVKSLEAVGELVIANGAFFCEKLNEAVDHMYASSDAYFDDIRKNAHQPWVVKG